MFILLTIYHYLY